MLIKYKIRKALIVRTIITIVLALMLTSLQAVAIVPGLSGRGIHLPLTKQQVSGGPSIKAVDYTANGFNAWPPHGGWMINPVSGSGAWKQGSLEMGSGVSPDSGCEGTLNFAEFDSWDYSVGVTGDIISPQVTLPNPADSCSLSFYVWNHSYSVPDYNFDSLLVQITTDGGGNWSNMTAIAGDIDSWTLMAFSLSSYAGQNIQVRFRAKSDYGASNMSIDQVRIGKKPGHDVSVVNVLNPGSSMPGPGTPETVVLNNGTAAETFEVICTIDSAGTEVYADSKIVTGLAAGTQQLVTFNSYAPAIGNGKIYTASFNTVLAGDGDPSNDTLNWDFNTYSVQRTVIAMEFTGTWCTYCPWHQVGWQMMKDAVNDSIVVLAVHSGDSFAVATYSSYLYSYYTTQGGLPTSVMDGTIEWVGSYTSDSGAMQYNAFHDSFNKQKNKKSPFELVLNGHVFGDTGTVYVALNYPGSDLIPISIRVAIVQTSKFQPWQTSGSLPQDSLFDLMRGVITPAEGDTFIVLNGSNTRSYFFTLNPSWDKTKLTFVAWVESRGLKENLQAGEIKLSEFTGVSGRPDQTAAVERTMLLPCYPNPATDRVAFKYNLKETGPAELKIYDICGRLVHTLTDGIQQAGFHTVSWDVEEDMANGIYLYKLTTGEHSSVKKLTILR